MGGDLDLDGDTVEMGCGWQLAMKRNLFLAVPKPCAEDVAAKQAQMNNNVAVVRIGCERTMSRKRGMGLLNGLKINERSSPTLAAQEGALRSG